MCAHVRALHLTEAQHLSKEAPGPREVRWSETPAHGMRLLAAEPDLVRALVEWFQRTLGQ